jgi:threonine aldolase
LKNIIFNTDTNKLNNTFMINLISDTVTKPSAAMLAAMMSAVVGDDVFREDPTVNMLEAKVAAMFGMEAALYCPSGTMTNQLAIKTHTQPMDEMICENLSHVYRSENGGYALHSGIAVDTILGQNGKITAEQIATLIKPAYDWQPKSRLVVLENTTNFGGGNYYTIEEIKPIRKLCTERGLSLHLDGARLFNALVETGDTPTDFGTIFDSISICLSKGLGAPVGSLLIGNQAFIAKARRFRKAFGGGMRQAGFLAAAGIFALDNNIERLREDHANARLLGETLERLPYVENVRPVKTNIVIFDVKAPRTAANFVELLAQKGIKAAAFGPQTIRFVTHLDVNRAMIEKVVLALEKM